MADLKAHGSIFLAARGGAGGHGNLFYLSNSLRTPLKAEFGGRGEEVLHSVHSYEIYSKYFLALYLIYIVTKKF